MALRLAARLRDRRNVPHRSPFARPRRRSPRRRAGALSARDGGDADRAAVDRIPQPPARRDDRGREYAEADVDFFDDLVTGTLARAAEIDGLIAGKLAAGWTLERLDKPMKAILRVGSYELLARADVPSAAAISEYVDVAKAFYDKRESGFVNGLLDAIAKQIGR